MIPLGEIDLSRLNGQLQMLQDALVGAGQPGDMQIIVKDEARLLAMEISNSLGPSSKEIGERRIRSDMKSVFMDMPPFQFQGNKTGQGSIHWLVATPKKLFGVGLDDYEPNLSISGMKDRLREHQVIRVGVSAQVTRQGLRKKQTYLGQRGKQRMVQINRIMVPRGQTAALAKDIADKKVGRLRATFAYAANLLGQTRIPAWIKKHFETVAANGRAIFDGSKLNDKQAPTIVFGSAAPGIENFEGIVLEAIDRRESKLYTRISGIIHGYSTAWKAGLPLRTTAQTTP